MTYRLHARAGFHFLWACRVGVFARSRKTHHPEEREGNGPFRARSLDRKLFLTDRAG